MAGELYKYNDKLLIVDDKFVTDPRLCCQGCQTFRSCMLAHITVDGDTDNAVWLSSKQTMTDSACMTNFILSNWDDDPTPNPRIEFTFFASSQHQLMFIDPTRVEYNSNQYRITALGVNKTDCSDIGADNVYTYTFKMYSEDDDYTYIEVVMKIQFGAQLYPDPEEMPDIYEITSNDWTAINNCCATFDQDPAFNFDGLLHKEVRDNSNDLVDTHYIWITREVIVPTPTTTVGARYYEIYLYETCKIDNRPDNGNPAYIVTMICDSSEEGHTCITTFYPAEKCRYGPVGEYVNKESGNKVQIKEHSQ